MFKYIKSLKALKRGNKMFIDKILKQAKNNKTKIIFPEAEDERILKAIASCEKYKIVDPILVGNIKKIRASAKKHKVNINNYIIIEPKKDNLKFACEALKKDYADAMIAGSLYTSADVIKNSYKIVGLQKRTKTFSSFFVMDLKQPLMFADCAVMPNPTSRQLADIAISTAKNTKKLLKIEPKVAMLSFSTKGSAKHKDVTKVIQATKLAKKSKLKIDGELQADTALVESIAKRKLKNSKVAGKANTLIFPDLNSGNIAYKLTQYFTGCNAYGPILQGFAKPISDLSRGCKVEDIIGVIAIISTLSK